MILHLYSVAPLTPDHLSTSSTAHLAPVGIAHNHCYPGYSYHYLVCTMQNTCRSSKGKGRAGDADGYYAQSFASLNLGARGDHLAPRKDSYDQLHTDAHISFCASNSQGPQALTESSLASSGPVAINGSPCLDTPSHSSTGTAASSAPSANSNQTGVKNTFKCQIPQKPLPYLPCEFCDLTGCDITFPRGDMDSWRDHVEWHLQNRFPTKLRCCKQPILQIEFTIEVVAYVIHFRVL